MRITQRAYGKINWALDVVGRREDGYHELDMLMQTVALSDELSFESDGALSLTVRGRPVPSDGRNLVLRAAQALMDYTGRRHGARIHLVKHIPVRAGLGGGSADCGAALLALNRLWRLDLPLKTLLQIGGSLGADVPFCMGVGLARVRGVGERLLRMEAKQRFPLVILHPGPGLSTPQVFGQWDRMGQRGLSLSLDQAQSALASGDLAAFARMTGNALEPPAMVLLPEIWQARDKLRQLGAVVAQMSGSGSAVFGAFDNWEKARAAKEVLGYRAILTWTYP